MKVTLIASVSANGKVLLANNPNHQIAPEVMGFLVQKAIESGNIVFGYSTYTMFIDALQDALAGKEIVVLSNNHEARSGHKTVHTPEEAVEYLRGKGMEEIVVGGGVQTYNAFLDKDLVQTFISMSLQWLLVTVVLLAQKMIYSSSLIK